MTAPVSFVPAAALPAAAGTGATAAAPDDVFASVLAALAGALGLPVPVQQPVAEPAHATPQPGTAAVGVAAAPVAAPGTGTAEPSPAVWTAVTQRPVLPITAAPTAPADAKATAPAGRTDEPHIVPGHLPRTSQTSHRGDAPVVAPTTADARGPEAAPAAVPAHAAAPVVDAAAVPPPVVAPSAPVRGPHAEAPVAAVTSTHHVKPALLDAARGLRHEGGGRTSLVVRLDPPELGAVLVKLTVQDGRVDVTLRTPDLAARADLQAQSYDVEQVLREQGFDLSSFDVAHGDVLPDGRQDAPDRGTPDRNGRADGHPTHSPVTDDGPAPEPSGTWL